MISIDEYKANPCRVSSVPYWKMVTIKKPDNITLVHDDDYIEHYYQGVDTPYFRLIHYLENVESINSDRIFTCKNVDTNSINDLEDVVSIINKSYTDIQVIPEYRHRGLGQAVVNRLLLNMVGKADFVTVSGQVNNNTNPEKLYRRCGFQGNAVWHVISK